MDPAQRRLRVEGPRLYDCARLADLVCGLTAAQIPKAFLVPEATVGQRITRAKRKITQAGIPYWMPAPRRPRQPPGRGPGRHLPAVHEGYLSSGRAQAQSCDLVDESEFLAALLHQLMPTEPEVLGLLALIRLHQARAAASFDPDGRIIQLRHRTVSSGTTTPSPKPAA